MKAIIIHEGIAVLAEQHNPSLLHPSFLKFQGIVPERWETKKPPICTPAFSVVEYQSGVAFVVEPDKLQVTKSPPTDDPTKSELPNYTWKYVSTLEHVPYRAIGINFSAILPREEAGMYLTDRFLQRGTWTSEELRISSVSLRFVYLLDSWTLALSSEPGEALEPLTGGTVRGVIVSANYHHKLPGSEALGDLQRSLEEFGAHFAHFRGVMRKVFEVED